LSAGKYEDSVDVLQEWLSLVDAVKPPTVVTRRLAAVLVLLGFREPLSLDGAELSDIVHLIPAAVDKALLQRALRVASSRGAELARQRAGSSGDLEVAPAAVHVAGAEDLLKKLDEGELLRAEEFVRTEAGRMRVPVPGDGSRPGEVIQALGMARARGADVAGLLKARKEALLLETQRKSLPSVAAGLRCWHAYAVHLLGYDEEASLPPRCADHVATYVCLFSSGATAANYVSYLRWSCTLLGLQKDWDDDQVAMALKASKKATVRKFGGPKHAAVLILWPLVQKLVALWDEMGQENLSVATLVFWAFLLRVQSEGLELQAGAAGDLVKLPLGRHSAVFVENNVAVCVLKKRKHRPQGSVLRRPCWCSKFGPQYCVVHRLGVFLNGCESGERLWAWNGPTLLKEIKRAMALLMEAGAEQVTLKGFRAGAASWLVMAGYPPAAVLSAGEWKTAAVLAYVNAEAVDAHVALDMALQESDEE